jgi:2-methylisocitrate lyase-like PEP mutase family enzyme
MSAIADRAGAFRRLHRGPSILVLPNAWDAASAAVFAASGFPAVATSSGAVAFAAGYPDGEQLPREQMLASLERICAAVDVPVTADIEKGYGSTPEEVAETVRLVIEAGAVGVNLEDGLGPSGAPALRPVAEQLERLRAARRAAEAAGVPLFVNARTDVYLAGIGEPAGRVGLAIERAAAYAEGGADGVFVPGVVEADAIRAIASAVPAPLNVFIRPGLPSLAELHALGVARLSLATAPILATLGLLRKISRELLETGTYTALQADAVAYPEMQGLFAGRRGRPG